MPSYFPSNSWFLVLRLRYEAVLAKIILVCLLKLE